MGLDNYLFNHECSQSNEGGIGYGPNFSFQLKHFDYKIYEVNITETYNEVMVACNYIFYTLIIWIKY